MTRKATVSPNQAFTRFLPGAVETVDGETVNIDFHEITPAFKIDDFTRTYLLQRVKSAVAEWPHRDATYSSFLENPESSAIEFVSSVRLVALSLPIVECRRCKAVADLRQFRNGQRRVCHRESCRQPIRVVPFVEIHSCGAHANLRVPRCSMHGTQFIVLERQTRRRWRCREGGCTWEEPAFPGYCGQNCYFNLLRVQLDQSLKRRSQILVGANSLFRPQSIDVLNPPHGEYGKLFRDYPEYVPSIFLARYFDMPEVDFHELDMLQRLLDEIRSDEPRQASSKFEDLLASMNISDEERAKLRAEVNAAGSGHSALRRRIVDLKTCFENVAELVPEVKTGVIPQAVLKEVYDLLLALALQNSTSLEGLIARLSSRGGVCAIQSLELAEVKTNLKKYALCGISLVNDFPIVSCAFGYTRGAGVPESSVLRAFPKRPSVYGGQTDKTPFYVISNKTEALVFELDQSAVLSVLIRNDIVEAGSLDGLNNRQQKAWVLRQFNSNDLPSNSIALSIFTIVHSYAHRVIEQIALESCFSATSLSEMIMPATLSFAVYVNQRSEFNIGGLASFVEQRLQRALDSAILSSPCMFDPICTLKDNAACNGCLFLPEVTCREFNRGLTRAVMYGGQLSGELAAATGLKRFVGLFDQASASVSHE